MGSVANTDVTITDAVVPKREASIERYTDSSASTPEPSDTAGAGSEQASKEPVPAPKRKGGRKPVRFSRIAEKIVYSHKLPRSMRHPKNANNGIVKRRPHFESDGPSISNNSRPLSSTMRRLSKISSKVTAPRPMSV